VARTIFETGTRHGKRVQAAGGAKNFVIVMPDADIGNSVAGLVDTAFGCAGQHCMAGSTAVTVGPAAAQLLPPLAEAAAQLRVGPTDRDPLARMGALISAAHRERVRGLIAGSLEEGASLLLDGRGIHVPESPNGFYLGPTIIDHVREDMTVAREEIFGPVLNVVRVDHLEQAIELANRNAFGNGACIYTGSGKTAREFRHRVKAGMVGINVGVPDPLAYFPFSGWDYSFFGDLHLQGREGILFYTRQKVTTFRWFQPGEGDIWHQEVLNPES
jgi:malonate-semialdehyde dehydrogenase (acetylating)/methylmalonate-semialdehyde dehydrogenase